MISAVEISNVIDAFLLPNCGPSSARNVAQKTIDRHQKTSRWSNKVSS
jgi:hypothetical protein